MNKFIWRLCSFLFIIILFNFIFVWNFEKDERQAIADGTFENMRIWKDIHSNNSYNIIILGSSRGLCAYNPKIIDSITNGNSYNMCTGLQNVLESYYMLKEILRFQKPKIIIYEIFLPSFKNTPDYSQVLSNAKFMSSKGRYDMMLNGFGIDGLINYVLPVLKYKPYLKYNYSFFFLKNKDIETYNNTTSYFYKGYYSNKAIADSNRIREFQRIYNFKNTSVSMAHIKYCFDKIYHLCQVNNIKLICVRAAYPPSRLKISPSDTVHIYFKNLCNNYKIPFYDFNSKYSNVFNDSDFIDETHLNDIGAEKISTLLARMIKTSISYPCFTEHF